MLNFFTKMLLKKQLKGKVPEEQIDQMLAMVEKNPDYFKEMAAKIQDKMKQGMSQEEAAMEVAREDGEKLKQMIGK